MRQSQYTVVVGNWLKQKNWIQTYFQGPEASFMLLTPQKAMQTGKKIWRNKIQGGKTIKMESILLLNWVKNIFVGEKEHKHFRQLN